VNIPRIKVDLHQALGWDDDRRDALLEALDQWRDGPEIKYTTGHQLDYYLTCQGDDAAEQVRVKLREFGLKWEPWGPQPDTQ
jgi:sugar (pentulose or hexulose) kinase